jgi:hypothetical protein
MLKSKKNPKSGQAMIEFLPAILLFFVIIAASIVFFIGLRESFNMQMAARNALFAKIRNSGPLVSPPGGSLGFANHYDFPITGATNPAVTQGNVCFTARPETNVTQAILPKILGLGLSLDRAHRATIFRKPGSPNTCD